jgi:hypothetical protein
MTPPGSPTVRPPSAVSQPVARPRVAAPRPSPGPSRRTNQSRSPARAARPASSPVSPVHQPLPKVREDPRADAVIGRCGPGKHADDPWLPWRLLSRPLAARLHVHHRSSLSILFRTWSPRLAEVSSRYDQGQHRAICLGGYRPRPAETLVGFGIIAVLDICPGSSALQSAPSRLYVPDVTPKMPVRSLM